MPLQIVRIIDANLNRAGEGLRLLEDVARFILDDKDLAQELRAMRHDLLKDTDSMMPQLLSRRDAEHDIGAATSDMSWQPYPELLSLVTANSRRIAESLRVIAELARCQETSLSLDPAEFEQARFRLYSVEKKLTSKLLRQEKVGKLGGVYAVLDTQALRGRNGVEVATQVIRGGARVVQLRDKSRSQGELLAMAKELKQVCGEAGALFIVNDYPDLVLASDADGLHLGRKDLPLAVARNILPVDKIIGCSANTVEQALEAEKGGADYVAIGAVYASPTRPEAEVAGLDILRQARETLSLPLVAIGGINQDNIGEVIAAGADAAAVISAILDQDNIELATRKLVEIFSGEENRCRVQS